MSIDEGYVKYSSIWTIGPAPDPVAVERLNTWRKPLFDANLIGYYEEHGVGFGNISLRSSASGQFVISGTQTGHIAITNREHYALVTDYDIEENRVACFGPIQASSEALTHAAIYSLSDNIDAIVHVHSHALFNTHINTLPTTNASVAYGTPDMAREFERLWRETDFRTTRIAVMAGHDEGLLSFGDSIDAAAIRMLSLYRAT